MQEYVVGIMARVIARDQPRLSVRRRSAPRRTAFAGLRRWLALAAWTLPHAGFAQALPGAAAPACASFLGSWSGTWSQGQYGKQRIHVTEVSEQCIATLGYSPTEAMPQDFRPVRIREGVMAFPCNVPLGTCRLEVIEDVLRFTYNDPSGFVNIGTFRREP